MQLEPRTFVSEVVFYGLQVLAILTLGNNYLLGILLLAQKGNNIFYQENSFQVENCGLQMPTNNE